MEANPKVSALWICPTMMARCANHVDNEGTTPFTSHGLQDIPLPRSIPEAAADKSSCRGQLASAVRGYKTDSHGAVLFTDMDQGTLPAGVGDAGKAPFTPGACGELSARTKTKSTRANTAGQVTTSRRDMRGRTYMCFVCRLPRFSVLLFDVHDLTLYTLRCPTRITEAAKAHAPICPPSP
ncbi:hypothetical protein VTK56DRAFT_9863 [Thermocarpiscus australiensis]